MSARDDRRRERAGGRSTKGSLRGTRPWRPGLDRAWWLRIALVVIVAVAIVLVARVALMAFGGAGARLKQSERGVEPPAAGRAASPTSPGRPP